MENFLSILGISKPCRRTGFAIPSSKFSSNLNKGMNMWTGLQTTTVRLRIFNLFQLKIDVMGEPVEA
jgi:hypothetical protein